MRANNAGEHRGRGPPWQPPAAGALPADDYLDAAAFARLPAQQARIVIRLIRDEPRERIGLDLHLSSHTVDDYVKDAVHHSKPDL